jgi:hypothetical protein
VKLRGPDAGTATPYCKRHDRLLEEANEAYKRGAMGRIDEWLRARGIER